MSDGAAASHFRIRETSVQREKSKVLLVRWNTKLIDNSIPGVGRGWNSAEEIWNRNARVSCRTSDRSVSKLGLPLLLRGEAGRTELGWCVHRFHARVPIHFEVSVLYAMPLRPRASSMFGHSQIPRISGVNTRYSTHLGLGHRPEGSPQLVCVQPESNGLRVCVCVCVPALSPVCVST